MPPSLTPADAVASPGSASPVASGQGPAAGSRRGRHARRGAALRLAFLVVVAGAAVVLFPALARIPDRLSRACAGWLTSAAGLELLSATGYVGVFVLTFCGGMPWRRGSRIACGSLGAGTLLPAGGVAGPALGAACARAEGARTPSIPTRIITFFVLTNAPNLIALAALGLTLWTGVLPGPRSPALTALPAVVALALLALIAVMSACAGSFREPDRLHRPWGVTAGLRALATGAREALTLIRRRHWMLIAAFANYGFDNAALWATFRAFGHSPAPSVVVMAFLIGGLGNALPLPAGVGGIELGLFGSLILYGAAAAPAATAVLAYRVVSTAVPLVLGGIALRGLQLPTPRELRRGNPRSGRERACRLDARRLAHPHRRPGHELDPT